MWVFKFYATEYDHAFSNQGIGPSGYVAAMKYGLYEKKKKRF